VCHLETENLTEQSFISLEKNLLDTPQSYPYERNPYQRGTGCIPFAFLTGPVHVPDSRYVFCIHRLL
jgi:hypothetical protein